MKALKITNLLLLVFFIGCSSTSNVKNNSQKLTTFNNVVWNYEIEPLVQGSQGTYLFKVWSYLDDPNMISEIAPKNAIHAVLFKGIPALDRQVAQPPIIESMVKNDFNDFFDEFFRTGGEYLKYVNLTSNGAIATGDRLKISEGRTTTYKIGMVVSINKDILRKRMEEIGVITSMGDIFN